MKYVILVALFGLALARPQAQNPKEITNVRLESVINPDGTFRYVSENSDGTIVEQSSRLVNPEETDPEKKIYAVEGSVKYVVDGQTISYTYVADQNGYAPNAPDLLPTPPPTPDYILKSIASLPKLQQRRRK